MTPYQHEDSGEFQSLVPENDQDFGEIGQHLLAALVEAGATVEDLEFAANSKETAKAIIKAIYRQRTAANQLPESEPLEQLPPDIVRRLGEVGITTAQRLLSIPGVTVRFQLTPPARGAVELAQKLLYKIGKETGDPGLTPLSVLDLPTRADNALKRHDIRTVQQLMDLLRKNELLEVRQIGPDTAETIMAALEEYTRRQQQEEA